MQEKLKQGAKFVGVTAARTIIGLIVVGLLGMFLTYIVAPLRNTLLLPVSLYLTKPMIVMQVTTTLCLWIETILAVLALLVIGMLIRPLIFREKPKQQESPKQPTIVSTLQMQLEETRRKMERLL